MVDDSMEISSDNGRSDEQGDIDLDLDLTGDHGDEDFILEDATSHVDFGDDFHPQPSAVVNDDIMLDDDNESYQMEDADILEEETEHIIEQESMSFATDGDALYYVVDGQIGNQSLADDTNGLAYEGYDANKVEPLGFDLQQSAEVVLPEENLQDPDNSPAKSGTEVVAQGTSGPGSQLSSPSRQSLPPVAPAEPRSPPASILEACPSPVHSTHANTDPISLHDSDNSTVDIPSVKDASSLEHVIVVYRDVEYALFSASEHDDPDLYFLSDKAIAEKPLSEFFRAIRDVIRDDLTDEDELCLVVDSLGLQAEEVSSCIDEVSLLQVLSLHAKLAENDGLENSGGCHITLQTRTNFSRRFSSLMAGAAEGKGLSHYAYWNGQSLSLDDAEDPGESKFDFESNADGEELAEATGSDNEKQQYESAEVNAPGRDLVGQTDEQVALQVREDESEKSQQPALLEATSSSSDPVVITAETTAFTPASKQQDRESDVDEDGDLIDYSDDEDVKIEEKRKAPARHTDNDETAAEDFEQRDELLRRRSLDRRQPSVAATPEERDEDAEETAVEHQPEEQEEGIEQTALEHQQSDDEGETTLLAEDGGVEEDADSRPIEKEEPTDQNEIGYEQYEVRDGEDADDNGYGHFTHNNPEYGHKETDHDVLALSDVAEIGTENDENNATLEQYGEVGYHGDTELDPDYAAKQGANYESAISNFENEELEFEVGENSYQGEPEQENDLLGLNATNRHIGTQDASNASSLDIVETAESSVTMGADEIQYEDDLLEDSIVADPDKRATLEPSPEIAKVADQKDEIDYDDEEEEEAELSLPSPAPALETQGHQNANGKRSIADVESNDSQTQATDAKRPRS